MSSSKRRGANSSSFANSFAALSLSSEAEPTKVPSRRQQKKLEYRARKALTTACTTHHQQQQSGSPGSEDSDGLQAALEAIALAESQQQHQRQQQHHQQQQQDPDSEELFWPVAAAGCGVKAAASPNPSPPASSGRFSGWRQKLHCQQDTTTSEQWQQWIQQEEAEPSSPTATTVTAAALSSSSSSPYSSHTHNHHQLNEQAQASPPPPFPPFPAAQADAEAGGGHPHLTSSQAYQWRAFAISFAEAAREAADTEAADGALAFGASTSVYAVDDAAAVELEGVAEQAAAAGLTVAELLQAQQAELLLQINNNRRAASKGPVWRQLPLNWAAANGGSSHNTSSSSSPVRPPAQGLPDVGCESAFPVLEASPAAGGDGWQQVGVHGRSHPLAVPLGWKGGRLKRPDKPSGIKLLNTNNSSSNSSQQQQQSQQECWFKPSTQDLHWDLVLDGLAPMQRDSSSSGGGGGALGLAAAERTRQMLAEQEAAAAAAAGAGGGSSSSSRDRLAQDTVRSMMAKAASKGASHNRTAAAAISEEEEDEEDAAVELCGSKAAHGYDWSSVFKSAMQHGWVPVSKADGGGGSHFKLRRVLPVSGVTQTMMIACTPSDSQRGVRNAASVLRKREEEKMAIEAQAAEEKKGSKAKKQQQQQAGSSSSKGGKRRT